MVALWIGLGVLVALFIAWRLRRAAKVLDLILRDELDRSDVEQPQAESRKQ